MNTRKIMVIADCLKYIFIMTELIMFSSSVNQNMDIASSISNKNADKVYNPVLTNHSGLFDWIKKSEIVNFNRQKRSTISWKCSGLCKQSLCTWTEVLDFDSRRIPAGIKKAVCSHNCNFNGSKSKTSQILDVLTSCQPLKTDIPVFMNNENTYIKDWPVACICSRQIISHIPHAHGNGRRVRRLKLHKGKRKQQARHIQRKHRHERNKLKPEIKPFLLLPQYK